MQNKEISSQFNLSIKKIIVSQLNILPCKECRHCSIDGICVVNDNMQQVYPEIIDADLIVIASPIFFTTISGYLKAFIDRLQRFWALKYELKKNIFNIKNKKGIFLSCAGSDRIDIFDCAKKVIRASFDVIYTSYYKDFCFNKIDLKDDIKKDSSILNAVFNYAKNTNFTK